ncbi:MAG TPA: hypothetical protein VHY91_08785 [Pirellulales bacterium]|jgi:hypothetical protein|nr:hypothetical protein [Pirellulales bacterium]
MSDFDSGLKRGYAWAQDSATAAQLEHLAREVFRPKSIFDVATFLGVRASSLVGNLEECLLNSTQFAEGFIAGALVALAEIYSEVSILDSFRLDIEPAPPLPTR